jgi:hypothetical protein
LGSLLNSIKHIAETPLDATRRHCKDMHTDEREDHVKTDYIDTFGKDGWYSHSLKNKYADILEGYNKLIKGEKDILSLLDKLRVKFPTALAA